MTRTEQIIEASADPGGYNKVGSYGVAWQEGAMWADKNPSKELIEQILTICNHIKDEEKSEFAPLNDCPYGYMVDELVAKIQERILKQNAPNKIADGPTSYVTDWQNEDGYAETTMKQAYENNIRLN